MVGVIKLYDVAWNWRIVAAGWGWLVLARCLLAAVRREPTTFLALVSR